MIFSCGKTFKSSRIRNLCLVDENQKNSHNTTALITLHNRLTRHVWFGVSLAQNVKNGKKNLEFQKEILCKISKWLLNALFSIINFIYDSTMRSLFFNPTVVESCFFICWKRHVCTHDSRTSPPWVCATCPPAVRKLTRQRVNCGVKLRK